MGGALASSAQAAGGKMEPGPAAPDPMPRMTPMLRTA